MVILSVIKKELRHILRSPRSNISMIVYPLGLIAVLGFGLASAFNGGIQIKGTVLYTSSVPAQYESSVDTLGTEIKKLGLGWEESEAAVAKRKLAGDEIVAWVDCSFADRLAFQVYKNSQSNLNAEFVEDYVKGFALRYGTVATLMSQGVTPGQVASTSVKTNSRQQAAAPKAMDYFSITTLSMILLFAAFTGQNSMRRERLLHTANRVFSTPASQSQYFVGLVLGGIVITVLQAAVVMGFSSLVFSAHWSNNLAVTSAIYIAEAIMAVSIGIGVSTLVRSPAAAGAIYNLVFLAMSFLGGSFYPLDRLGDVGNMLAQLSPTGWVNRSVLASIFKNDTSMALPAIALCLGIAAIFLVASKFRKGVFE